MKKVFVLLFVVYASLAKGQEIASCNIYNEYGDFVKAKSCLTSLESKYASDPAFFYYKMFHAVRSRDSVMVATLMGTIGNFPPTDFHILSAKTIYLVYSHDLNQAKTVYDGVLKNHKMAPVPVILDVARSFIGNKSKDPAYTLLWITTLEKEVKSPHAGLNMLKADYYASLGDQGNALNYYNIVLDIEPKNSVGFYKKAVAYRRIKNPAAALTELESALAITPDFPLAVLEKAEVLFELNKVDVGIIWYNNYFKMVPDDKLAHLQYGSSLFSVKKFAEAEKEADFVLQTDPKNISALKLKSYTCYEQGRYAEGLPMLENYILSADTSMIHSRDYEYLARFYLKAGSDSLVKTGTDSLAKARYDSLAIEAFKKALVYPGAKAELFSEAGNMMIKKSRFEDALFTYQSKMERYKGTSADYFNYGRSALALENYVLADSLFGIVCDLQPTWPNGFLMRANANTHLDPGSTEGKAFPYYEKFISLAEADTVNAAKLRNGLLESYKYMGYFYYLKKEIDKSKFYWKKVLELDPNDKQAKEVMKQL